MNDEWEKREKWGGERRRKKNWMELKGREKREREREGEGREGKEEIGWWFPKGKGSTGSVTGRVRILGLAWLLTSSGSRLLSVLPVRNNSTWCFFLMKWHGSWQVFYWLYHDVPSVQSFQKVSTSNLLSLGRQTCSQFQTPVASRHPQRYGKFGIYSVLHCGYGIATVHYYYGTLPFLIPFEFRIDLMVLLLAVISTGSFIMIRRPARATTYQLNQYLVKMSPHLLSLPSPISIIRHWSIGDSRLIDGKPKPRNKKTQVKKRPEIWIPPSTGTALTSLALAAPP